MSPVGTKIISRETAPPRSAPTDTGVMFAVGLTEKGKAGATAVTSLADFVRRFGDRVSYGMLYDAADTFFREGGGKMYVSRVFGPAPVTAGLDLSDGTNPTLRVNANSPGEWGNSLRVQVVNATTTFRLVISHATLGALETSPDFTSKTEALAWAANSSYIELVNLACTGLPATIAATALASGTDDRTNATDATWKAALDLITKDLGPGQVTMPGRTTSQAHTDLLAHSATNNRLAILDAPDTATVATLKTSASTLRALANARYGGLFAPWLDVPGITPGTVRRVPPSATVAGIMARNDAAGLTPNEPSAGANGISRFALDTSADWNDAQRDELNEAGVNVLRMQYGQIKVYGYRTTVNPLTTAENFLMLSNSRLYMAIAAKADVIAENYVLKMLDGRRRTISRFGGELIGMLIPYFQAGALFGETPDEAFFVDVGAQVNTEATMAARQLNAVISLRMSPFGELVTIEIVKVPITEAVA